MSRHSLPLTEAHFDAKAERYQMALRAAPHARCAEVVPFLGLLQRHLRRPRNEVRIADLLCGSGYLSRALASSFRDVVGVDISAGMLQHFPVSPRTSAVKAGLDEHPEVLAKRIRPDVILALAGLHHVYEPGLDQPDVKRSLELQAAVLTGWANALPADGIMLCADVTAPEAPTSSIGDLATGDGCAGEWSVEAAQCWNMLRNAAGCPASDVPHVEEYAKWVSREWTGQRPEPALWFREVVAVRGQYGHEDFFLHPGSLVEALTSAGFQTGYVELVTPWVFAAEEQMLSFYYDKFAFGPPVASVVDIPRGIREFILRQAERYLGIASLASGAIAVGWRLGYYLAKREGP